MTLARAAAISLIGLIATSQSVRAQPCVRGEHVPTALVLSGGGAKGLAHIGVLRTLDSLGIQPDLVVGTSMGAVVGAMYASGYTARQIDSLTRTLPLASLFRSYEPTVPQSLGIVQPLVVWEEGERGLHLQSATVREADVNALLNALLLRGNLIARGSFDSLPIRFRAVATDLADRSAVMLTGGDLARAVRASFAIPLVFPPERLDGRTLTDGGLVFNVPVAVARASGARRLIVSDVTGNTADSLDLDSPFILASHLLGFLFRQDADSLGPDDVRIRPGVAGGQNLDFSGANVSRMVDRGRAAADSALRSACFGIASPARDRRVPTRLAGVTVESGRAGDLLVLTRALGLSPVPRGDRGDTIDIASLQRRLLQLAESERYTAVWLSPRGSGDSVSFHLSVRYTPRRVAGLALAYDHELGGRAWLGVVDRRALGQDVETSAALTIGGLRQELALGLRRNFGVRRHVVRPAATALAALEDVRLFDSTGHELDEVPTREALGFVGVEWSITRSLSAATGAELRAWHQPGSPTTKTNRTAGAVLRLEGKGRGAETVLRSEGAWTPEYRRVELEAVGSGRLKRLRFRPMVRYGWGDALPLASTFPLGGSGGFPGLHIGERRGDREALVAALLSYPLKGALLVRAELMAGSSAVGGIAVPQRDWLVGVRAGLGADTPVGLIRFEYGVNSEGRGAVFVRIGRWD